MNNDLLKLVADGNTLNLSEVKYSNYFLITFSDYLDLSEKTKQSYKGALKLFFNYLTANGIDNPTRQDIIDYREHLINLGLKPTTIHAYINAIKKVFEWLEYNNIYKDIAKHVKSVRIINTIHRKDSLTLEQAQELLNSFKRDTLESKRNYAITLLALECGLRVIEMARADINDIRTSGGYRVIYIMGKGHQEKDKYNKVSPHLDNAIRDYLLSRGTTNDNAPLFTSISDRNNGDRLTTHSISRIIKTALRNVGLDSERLTAHSLRHTTATLNILLGGTLEETQELLRHANPSTTMIYINESNRLKNHSELRLENALLTTNNTY